MVTDFLIERFEEHGDAPAVIAPAARCSFESLSERIGDWTRELEERAIGSGSVVTLDAEFSPNAVALFVALADRGAIVVPRSRANRHDGQRAGELAQATDRIEVDEADAVRFQTTGRVATHALYRELAERGHPGLVMFSSGSSGEPKAAVHDLALLLEKFQRRRPPLSAIAFLMFDHLGGVNTMLHALSNGAAIVSPADRSPVGVCELVERHRVELLPTTPTFLNLLLLSGAHRRHDLSSLKVISYGAEPMPQATLDRLHSAFPDVRLQQTYGMTELGALRSKSREDGSLWVKVGGEGLQTRVVDGILQIQSRSMIIGYLNAELPVTDDGWLITGDAVLEDGEYLRFLGRQSDLINVGGEKVYPAEVEGVIEALDCVIEATVYGEPNQLVGEIVCADVTGASGVDGLVDIVKRHCRAHLDRYKVPVKVQVVTDSPHAGGVKKRRRRPPATP
jgi:acyl-CoA synthetase (AMP-forming)/AMP-acid ligase II